MDADRALQDGEGTKRDPQTYAILGAAMGVHRQLGNGFLEAVYQEALQVEMSRRGIPARREVGIPIVYKGQQLSCSYRADFICYDSVLVELKSIERLGDNEAAQVVHYLRATGLQRALLVNFGAKHLEFRRMVLTK